MQSASALAVVCSGDRGADVRDDSNRTGVPHRSTRASASRPAPSVTLPSERSPIMSKVKAIPPDVKPAGREVATLGGGCFWCLEAVYDKMQGVDAVESGYMGGDPARANYDAVCRGDSGHAEVVRVTFDPKVTTFREILEVFFVIHDPTTLNRQGNDAGPQYRSAIFFHTPEQKATADAVVAELASAKAYRDPIVTQIAPATEFFEAEGYHQEYFERNGYQPYCMFVVAPKVEKFRKTFASKVKR
jgi:peptide-methionine (S)-S-oxide reductase